MPTLPSRNMASFGRCRSSILPQEPSVMDPERLDEEAIVVNQEKRKKSKGPAPVVVLEGDILESTTEHRYVVSGWIGQGVIVHG